MNATTFSEEEINQAWNAFVQEFQADEFRWFKYPDSDSMVEIGDVADDFEKCLIRKKQKSRQTLSRRQQQGWISIRFSRKLASLVFNSATVGRADSQRFHSRLHDVQHRRENKVYSDRRKMPRIQRCPQFKVVVERDEIDHAD